MSQRNTLQNKHRRRRERAWQKYKAAERIPFYGAVSVDEPKVTPLLPRRVPVIPAIVAMLFGRSLA